MMPLTRREAAHVSLMAAAPAAAGFYNVHESGGRMWLLRPDGKREFSLGLNHIDPATLRYPENIALWKERYGGSMQRWLRESVRPSLLRWGFNCMGWNQEVVTRGATNHRHSRPFTADEYRALDMPFGHLLPFADFHQWEAETRHPDFFSEEFAQWCDHVAREHCVPLAEDRNLIGYFYIDCPTWVHTRSFSAWKGPLFDPAKLASESGRKELERLAERYYRVTHDAIRRYDKNHLILGDRYEAMMDLPEIVARAAMPFVDVLSFQHFGDALKIVADMREWHRKIGKPVLVADTAKNVQRPGGIVEHDPAHYRVLLEGLREVEGAIGVHLCGAFMANRVRRRGMLDANERPSSATPAIQKANEAMAKWVEERKA